MTGIPEWLEEQLRDRGRLKCPACDSDTSTHLRAFRDWEPCPTCGLLPGVTLHVFVARRQGANDELVKRYTEAEQRAAKAVAEAADLRRRLAEIGRVMGRTP